MSNSRIATNASSNRAFVWHRLFGRKKRSLGAALVETVVFLPVLLTVGLGTVQWALIYEAKSTLNYAALMGAREGAVSQADPDAIRFGLVRGLAPLYSPKESDIGAVVASTKVVEDIENGHIRVDIINPTQEAFEDFGSDLDGDGRREIPNELLHLRPTDPGRKSDVSIQDANLLKVQVLYGYPLHAPLVGPLIAKVGAALTSDPAKEAMFRARRLPILATATVRMQSPAEKNDLMLSKDAVAGLTPTPPDVGGAAGDPGDELARYD